MLAGSKSATSSRSGASQPAIFVRRAELVADVVQAVHARDQVEALLGRPGGDVGTDEPQWLSGYRYRIEVVHQVDPDDLDLAV